MALTAVTYGFLGGVDAENVEGSVVYDKKKEFISHLELLGCGCPKHSSENIAKIKESNKEVYDCYLQCDCGEEVEASYSIFPESGLIKVSQDFPYDEIYLEYRSFIPKVNGQYVVPEVAFETLVEGIKFKSIQHKANISVYEKQWHKQNYITAKKNMIRVLRRISLKTVLDLARSLPVFDVIMPKNKTVVPYSPKNASALDQIPRSDAQSVVTEKEITIISKGAFVLAKRVGQPDAPTLGATTYQNDELKGAKNIEYIIVSNQIETLIGGDFTFNEATGTIDRSPNMWAEGDTLIVNYNKKS